MDPKKLNGRYQLGALRGEGGMGAVYEAEDLARSLRVAAKVINPEFSRGGGAVERFEREAKAAGAIDTEHIARVLDSGTDEETGAPFIVMELLDGEDLGQLLRRWGPLPPPIALRIVAQACVGLERAHSAGVLHRDIKPANLFLARVGGGLTVVKLLDFGVAKIRRPCDAQDPSSRLTPTGKMLGTPRYMSPEQARARKDIDHRTDIWSLGIVLYRALTGRTPHEQIEAFGELITALVYEPPPPIRHYAPWVTPEVAQVVHTALQHDRDLRYSSAAAMLDAIMPLLARDLALGEGMLRPLAEAERAVASTTPCMLTGHTTTVRELPSAPLTASRTALDARVIR